MQMMQPIFSPYFVPIIPVIMDDPYKDSRLYIGNLEE